MVGRGGGVIRSLNEVLGRVAQSARGRSRRTDGASSSASAPAEDPVEGSGTVRGGRGRRGRRRSCRRSPSPVASTASEEEEDGAVPKAGTAGEEDEGNHQQEEEGDRQ